jgi:hypothetical protein
MDENAHCVFCGDKLYYDACSGRYTHKEGGIKIRECLTCGSLFDFPSKELFCPSCGGELIDHHEAVPDCLSLARPDTQKLPLNP